jgi:hypothetical protein
MNFGNMPADGGNLILSDEEKDELVKNFPQSEKFTYELIGAKELIQSHQRRWCLWLLDVTKEDIESMPLIKKRIDKLRQVRLSSSRPQLAKVPHLFAQITCNPKKYKTTLILPGVSSERRRYLPIRFSRENEVIANSCLAITDAENYHFAILISRMHTTWLRAVGGKMKTDYRYSKDIVYNNFPLRNLSEKEKTDLANSARNILFARENHSEKTLAEMYDPEKMPADLREAHHQNDILVDKLYRQKPYTSDEERLTDLFKLYEEMIAKEKE